MAPLKETEATPFIMRMTKPFREQVEKAAKALKYSSLSDFARACISEKITRAGLPPLSHLK